jgi:hypothetical protein
MITDKSIVQAWLINSEKTLEQIMLSIKDEAERRARNPRMEEGESDFIAGERIGLIKHVMLNKSIY